MTGAIMRPAALILLIITGIAVMTAATLTDTIGIEKVTAGEMATGEMTTKEETVTKETKATATMTPMTMPMTVRVPAAMTTMEGMGTTTVIMISAPITKNALTYWAGLNTTFAHSTKNGPICWRI